jgi:hypothetical protein
MNEAGDILVWTPQQNLEQGYLQRFQESKTVCQNLFYTANGASSFYSYRQVDLQEINWEDEYRFFLRQPFWSPDHNLAFVSLGCGNAAAEKPLLHHSYAAGYQVAYFGVDSSRAMLELAVENLADEDFARTFILADFTLPDFADNLDVCLEGSDAAIYAVIGGTFGNFDQHAIADVLARLIPSGDYLYLDVVPRPDAASGDMQLRGRFARLPENLRQFFDRLLARLNIPRDAGEVHGEEIPEGNLETLRYTFYFRATSSVTFPCFDSEVTLAPGERIELLSIRAYDPAALQAFLADRGFALQGTYMPDVGRLQHLWQRFLFQKI